MTIIRIKNKPGNYMLSALGHAGREEDGKGNLVCAAVSMMTQALVQFMRERAERMSVYQDRIGDAELFLKAQMREEDVEIHGAMCLTETGLSLLEELYPDRIRLVRE